MTETALSTPLTSAANAPLMFPMLSPAQIGRIASHGVIRPTTRGEVLIEGGQTDVPFFVLKAGEIEVIRFRQIRRLVVSVMNTTHPHPANESEERTDARGCSMHFFGMEITWK
jgi:thioredoxin reductase (NADPH)